MEDKEKLHLLISSSVWTRGPGSYFIPGHTNYTASPASRWCWCSWSMDHILRKWDPRRKFWIQTDIFLWLINNDHLTWCVIFLPMYFSFLIYTTPPRQGFQRQPPPLNSSCPWQTLELNGSVEVCPSSTVVVVELAVPLLGYKLSENRVMPRLYPNHMPAQPASAIDSINNVIMQMFHIEGIRILYFTQATCHRWNIAHCLQIPANNSNIIVPTVIFSLLYLLFRS